MAEIVLSAEQQACADAAISWDRRHFRDRHTSQNFRCSGQTASEAVPQVFRIDGYAGTGKSTIIKHITAQLEGKTLYAAFTGKATLVMRAKGCENPTTLHKLIYLSSGAAGQTVARQLNEEIDNLRQDYLAALEDDDKNDFENLSEVKKCREKLATLARESGNPIFRLNPDSELLEADRLVVDEVSMVGKSLAKDLLSFGVPVIVQGDPGQLPPVRDEGYFMQGDPDFFLTQIHRQAADSPVIQLATQARNRQPLRVGAYGDSRVLSRDQMTADMALEADQILCGRNKTRHVNNARMRALLGYAGPIPNVGEKLICLRNDHEVGMLNGALWRVVEARDLTATKLSLTLVPDEGGLPVTVKAHKAYFTQYGNTDQPGWVDKLEADEKAIAFDMRQAQCFTYGYVITVHKSQGSAWDKVLVLDESEQFGQYASNHLYTAITRAAKQVIVRL